MDLDLSKKLIEKGVLSVNIEDDFETAFSKALIDIFEPQFKNQGFVVLCDYPASQAALSKVEGDVARRFEFYVDGVEICNAFSEELREEANRERYIQAMIQRAKREAVQPRQDDEFYAALSKGVAPSCGNALGVDRWLGVLLGEKDLSNVLPFRNRFPFKN